jgi:hypothetical protein
MGTTGLIMFAIAVITMNLPRIIWAVRCPANSPNYKCPTAIPFRWWR